MRILVAEDDRITRSRIVAYLREWGHEPLEASDGEQAWRLFQSEAVIMVLTDWQMPGLDGVEFIKRCRELQTGRGLLYAILLTSRSEKKDVVEGIESGADDFITKPFDKDELRVRIRAGERILDLEDHLASKNRNLEDANRKIREANERMKRELKAAARIQQAFLPEGVPEITEARFAWHYEPCEELAGDTLNIIPFDEKTIGLYVIDVSGHGVAAALLSVHLSRLLTDLDSPDPYLAKRNGGNCLVPEPPARIAERLNQSFTYDLSTQQFFTLLYGILDLENLTFRYTSAGHPGPVVVRDGAATLHNPSPPGIGIVPSAQFSEETLDLRHGDRLFLYTDGAFEIDNATGEEFGQERLSHLMERNATLPLNDTLREVVRSIHAWRNAPVLVDDLSITGIEIV